MKESEIRSVAWKYRGIPFFRSQYSQHEFPPHFHDHFVIMAVASGVNVGMKERKRYMVDESVLLIINPGEVHTGSSFNKANLEYEAIYPDVSALTYIATHLELSRVRAEYSGNHIISKPRVTLYFKRLFASIANCDPTLACDSLLCDFLGELFSTENCEPLLKPENVRLKKAQSFLKDHYAESDVSLAQLSRYVGVSPFYLVRLFKRYAGQTPFEFLLNYRVERAKSLLSREVSLTQVGLDAGFYDQSHFIKSFKRITGVTPGAYASMK